MKLQLDPEKVLVARELAALAGQPVVEMAQAHTTVSIERAVLRMAGLQGADVEGIPWVNRLTESVSDHVGLDRGVALPVWDALACAAARRHRDRRPVAHAGSACGCRVGRVPTSRRAGMRPQRPLRP